MKFIKQLNDLSYIPQLSENLDGKFIEEGIFVGNQQPVLLTSMRLVQNRINDHDLEFPNQFYYSFISFYSFYRDFKFYRSRRKQKAYQRGEIIMLKNYDFISLTQPKQYLGYIVDFVFSFARTLFSTNGWYLKEFSKKME
jgi:hypothetical protein